MVGNYSEKVDIRSAGVLLHALFIWCASISRDSLDTVFQAIKKDKLDFVGGAWESVSQPACYLLSIMLTRNTSTRLTADGVLSKFYAIT